jgi:flagellar motor switch/type III secretory pathway protein FliN
METNVNLRFLEGVPVVLEAELGRRVVTLGELIDLKAGNVIRLPKTTGAPLDLVVGGALVGRAEVLALGSSRRVQVTEVGHVE